MEGNNTKRIKNEKAREYYYKNRDVIKLKNNERFKQYYKENREAILERLSNCKDDIREYNRQYYNKNKDKILERSKCKIKTPDEIAKQKEYMKEYRKKLKERMTDEDIQKRKEYMKNYRQKKSELEKLT